MVFVYILNNILYYLRCIFGKVGGFIFLVNTTIKIRVLNILIAVLLLFFSLAIPFRLLLSFNALYEYDIHYLHLDKQLQLSADEILANYKKIINYLQDPSEKELDIPGFPLSEQGLIHFQEVKGLFLVLSEWLFVGVALILGGIFLLWRMSGRFDFLKWTGNGLLLFSFFLVIPFCFSFENIFVIFHRLLFNNSYWIFDPQTDPIIKALPLEFFFHCGVFVLAIVFGMAILYHWVYIVLIKKYRGGHKDGL